MDRPRGEVDRQLRLSTSASVPPQLFEIGKRSSAAPKTATRSRRVTRGDAARRSSEPPSGSSNPRSSSRRIRRRGQLRELAEDPLARRTASELGVAADEPLRLGLDPEAELILEPDRRAGAGVGRRKTSRPTARMRRLVEIAAAREGVDVLLPGEPPRDAR